MFKIKLFNGETVKLDNSTIANKYSLYNCNSTEKLAYRIGYFEFDNSKWLTNFCGFVRVKNKKLKLQKNKHHIDLSPWVPKYCFKSIYDYRFNLNNNKKTDLYLNYNIIYSTEHIKLFLQINNYKTYDIQVIKKGIYLFHNNNLQGLILGMPNYQPYP